LLKPNVLNGTERTPAMQYCGIDLGKKSSHFCILDEKRTVLKRGIVRNRVVDFAKKFGEIDSMRIVIEASTKAFWVADRLEELGHDVTVVDPGKTKAIGAARIKHDKLDAKILAELCVADLLAKVDRVSEKERLARLIVVGRDTLVRSRVRLICSVRSILDSEGIELKSCRVETFADKVELILGELPEQLVQSIEPLLAAIRSVCEHIDDCDEQIKSRMKEDEEAKRIMTAPGMGLITASCFLMAVRSADRFQSGRQVGAYLGLVPSLYQSGQTYCRGKITKRGNRQARWALCVAANALLRGKKESALKQWGAALAERIGRKKAIIAIARKLCSILWAMMKNKTNFESRLLAA
jgi:transposase